MFAWKNDTVISIDRVRNSVWITIPGRRRGNDIPFTKIELPLPGLLLSTTTTSKWRRQKSYRQIQKHAHPGLKPLYKRLKARTSTAMPSRSSDSRCLVAVRPYATQMGKSSRPRHFRREKMRRRPGEYNQIGGGLVRCHCVKRTPLTIYTRPFYFIFHFQVTPG